MCTLALTKILERKPKLWQKTNDANVPGTDVRIFSLPYKEQERLLVWHPKLNFAERCSCFWSCPPLPLPMALAMEQHPQEPMVSLITKLWPHVSWVFLMQLINTNDKTDTIHTTYLSHFGAYPCSQRSFFTRQCLPSSMLWPRFGPTRCHLRWLCQYYSFREDMPGTNILNSMFCQAWASTTPHNHGFTSLEENYCRNPDGEPGPW